MPITLPSSIPLGTTSNYNMLDDGADIYWFHHKPSFPGADPFLYKEIITNARLSIEIWDPYFNENDYLIFDSVHNNVSIKILTSKGLSGPRTNYMIEIHDHMKALISPTKNVSFCIGVINKADYIKNQWGFHDRFLIIDNNEAYLIGASVENNYRATLSSGIYKINNNDTSNFIIAQFNNHWSQTVKLPTSGVQLLHP